MGKSRKYILNKQNKRHIPRSLGVDGFLNLLNKKNCRYVVIRWFDELPKIEYGEDIDILVHDDDAEVVDKILVRSTRKGTIPCGLYSVSGLSSYAYRGIAYYPPYIAE
ncbi:MAG: hypothetical protein LAT67_04095 [Balneolales bacterium]|nr:hypothetical protein [Balneolales bacterium]